MLNLRKIAVIGLGYVGLPVAVAFGQKTEIIGFDINNRRIEELRGGFDRTNEISADELKATKIRFTNDIEDLKKADFYIVAVPTPINNAKQPDLRFLKEASKTVGTALNSDDIVVFESTVYPGATEEECLPILENISGLRCGIDFKLGYSPERINPSDKNHSFTQIQKVVSAQDEKTLGIIAATYESVVTAGIYRAPSIKVAEAAKVIENAQRDLNIAFINELAIIFDLMDIDTTEVLAAAGTKWNFLPFKAGLVGGHCIGVDPYYLTYKAQQLGYSPHVILAGRMINDGMGKFIAQRTIKEMIHRGNQILGSTVAVLGLTFKENCPDLRNSKVIDIISELKEFGVNVQVHDNHADAQEAREEYGISLMPLDSMDPAAALIIAVAHDDYTKLSSQAIQQLVSPNGVVIDVKGMINKSVSADLKKSNVRLWRL